MPSNLPESDRDSVATKPVKKKKLNLTVLYKFSTREEFTLIVIASICAFIQGASRPALSFLFGTVIGSTATAGPDFMNKILWVTVALAILAVIVFIVGSIWFYIFSRVSISLTQRVQKIYFASVLSKDIAWFDARTPAEIPSRLSSDIEKIQTALASRAGNFIMNVSQAVCGFSLAFAKGWQIALVVLGTIPVIVLSRLVMSKSMANAATASQRLYAKAGAVAEEVLSSIRTVVAFGQEAKESKRYDALLDEGRKQGLKVSIQVGLGISLVLASMFLCYSLAIYIGGILIRDQVWNSSTNAVYTGADIYVILTSVIMGAFALGNIGPSLQSFTEGTAALEGLLETIREKSLIEKSLIEAQFREDSSDSGNLNSPPEEFEHLAFTQVSFRYPTRPDFVAITNLSLSIFAGQKIALVGESGSGKSTIIALIERFYDPETGSICINGIDIRSMRPRDVRSRFGYVGQEPVMFATSIRKNLLYGIEESKSDSDINKALKMANVFSFVSSLPDGLDTYCGPGGSQMSGGQKQRVAIARALLRNPKILLLDEATSALDNESEKMVQQTIDSLQSSTKLTTISVAHRLSTIRNSDVIFVFQRGGVLVEAGSHSQLMSLGTGLYKSLVASQAATMEPLPNGSAEVESLVAEKTASSGSLVVTPEPVVTKSDEQKEKERIALVAKNYSVPWKRLLAFTPPSSRWLYVPGILGSAGKGAVFPIHALIFSSVVAWYYIPDPTEMMRKIKEAAWIYVVIAVGIFTSQFVSAWAFGNIAESFTLQIRSVCFRHILSQEIGFFDSKENAPAKLLISLSSWANKMNVLAGQVVGVFVEFFAAMIAGLTVAFLASPKLTGILIGTLPLLIGGMVVVSRVVYNATKKDDVSSKQAGLVASEAVQNMRTIRALTAEKSTLDLYQSYSENRVNEEVKQCWKSGIVFGLSAAVVMVPYAIGFYVGGLMVDNGEITMQDLIQVLLGLILTSVGAGNALAFLPDIKSAKTACHDIFALLDRESKINPFVSSGSAVFTLNEPIVFDKVEFSYPERPDTMVLKGLSFSVNAGKKIALVGPSGGGKSTVMALLLRFYDPSSGRVLVGNTDIRDLDLCAWRGVQGYVGQEPVLFNATMADNVRYGKDGATEEELEVVRVQAKLDFVSNGNVSWDTVIGPKGGLLSGGQKQRTAIARAMVRDPQILLLDEATSALDSASEQVVQHALDNAAAARSTFVIAHRLSTIEDADVILVIVDGQLAESGSHEELIQRRGIYFRLYQKGTN
jgi:ABC-type multidrug transport system fused ATPase/permease subunit